MKTAGLFFALILFLGCAGRVQHQQTSQLDLSRTISVLRAQINKHPEVAQIRCELGIALNRARLYDEAIVQFDSALMIQPDLINARFGRTEALYLQGRRRQALRDFLALTRADEKERYVALIAQRIGCPYAIRQLTRDPGDNSMARYSPVGDEIVFQSNRDGNWEIYRTSVDGTLSKRLTHDPGDDETPDFSPDGRTIVFTSTRGSGSSSAGERSRDIYLMNAANGSQVRPLIQSPADDWQPVFAPVGDWLVFVSDREDQRQLKYGDKQSDLFLLYVKDSSLVRFTHGFGDKSAPNVAAQGQAILYVNNVNGNFDIYEKGIDEAGGHPLLSGGGPKGGPQYSYDGKHIVYFEKRDENFDIYLYDRESGSSQRLTCDPAMDFFPCMSRQGDRILFSSNRSGRFQIYEIDLLQRVSRQELVERLSKLVSVAEMAGRE